MKKMNPLLVKIVRIILGMNLLLNGLVYFVMGFPVPEGTPELAARFAQSMMDTGYVFALVKLVEAVTGIALLLNRFVPLALVVVAPVVINIVLFDTLLAPGVFSLIMGWILALLYAVMVTAYFSSFRPFLQAKVNPLACSHTG
jgi:hypothetical protein